MEPRKLDPEIKWRTVVSFFFNYITHLNKVLEEELDAKTKDTIIRKLQSSFWKEQGQALIDLLDIKPNSAIDAQSLKRTLAILFDINYKSIKETPEEVIDEGEFKFCPARQLLSPHWKNVCEFCEFWGRTVINQLGPGFTHRVRFDNRSCQHITSMKKQKP